MAIKKKQPWNIWDPGILEFGNGKKLVRLWLERNYDNATT